MELMVLAILKSAFKSRAMRPTSVPGPRARDRPGAWWSTAGQRLSFFAELHDVRNQFFVFGDEEDQLAAAGADGVAMSQEFAAYRNTIDESTVVTFQVDQVKGGIGFADGEMTARHGAIMQHKPLAESLPTDS